MPTGNERVPLTALHWGSTPGSGRNLPGVAGCRRAPARGDRADRLEPDRCRASLLERVAPFLRAALLGNVGRCHGRFPVPSLIIVGLLLGLLPALRRDRRLGLGAVLLLAAAPRRLPASSRCSRDRAQTGLPLPPRRPRGCPGNRSPGPPSAGWRSSARGRTGPADGRRQRLLPCAYPLRITTSGHAPSANVIRRARPPLAATRRG